jgi:hypothetical protein
VEGSNIVTQPISWYENPDIKRQIDAGRGDVYGVIVAPHEGQETPEGMTLIYFGGVVVEGYDDNVVVPVATERLVDAGIEPAVGRWLWAEAKLNSSLIADVAPTNFRPSVEPSAEDLRIFDWRGGLSAQ